MLWRSLSTCYQIFSSPPIPQLVLCSFLGTSVSFGEFLFSSLWGWASGSWLGLWNRKLAGVSTCNSTPSSTQLKGRLFDLLEDSLVLESWSLLSETACIPSIRFVSSSPVVLVSELNTPLLQQPWSDQHSRVRCWREFFWLTYLWMLLSLAGKLGALLVFYHGIPTSRPGSL
jgi:hypothetical protein